MYIYTVDDELNDGLAPPRVLVRPRGAVGILVPQLRLVGRSQRGAVVQVDRVLHHARDVQELKKKKERKEVTYYACTRMCAYGRLLLIGFR